MDEELTHEISRAMRVAASSMAQVLEHVKRHQAQRDQRARDRALDLMKEAEREHRDWVAAQRGKYQHVTWGDWQDDASLEQWSDAYAAARGLRPHDPQAAQACNVAEREAQRRFGVDLRAMHRDRVRQAEEEAQARAAAAGMVDRLSDPAWTASASPQEWAAVYAAARTFEHDDPRARAAADRCRQQFRDRWDVDVDALWAVDQAAREEQQRRQETTVTVAQDEQQTMAGDTPMEEAELVDVAPAATVADVVAQEAEVKAAKLAAEQNTVDMRTTLAEHHGAAAGGRRPRGAAPEQARDLTRGRSR